MTTDALFSHLAMMVSALCRGDHSTATALARELERAFAEIHLDGTTTPNENYDWQGSHERAHGLRR